MHGMYSKMARQGMNPEDEMLKRIATQSAIPAPPMGAGIMRPEQAQDLPTDTLNPYIQGYRQDPNNLTGRGRMNPDPEDILRRVMMEELRKQPARPVR